MVQPLEDRSRPLKCIGQVNTILIQESLEIWVEVIGAGDDPQQASAAIL